MVMLSLLGTSLPCLHFVTNFFYKVCLELFGLAKWTPYEFCINDTYTCHTHDIFFFCCVFKTIWDYYQMLIKHISVCTSDINKCGAEGNVLLQPNEHGYCAGILIFYHILHCSSSLPFFSAATVRFFFMLSILLGLFVFTPTSTAIYV